ncbi:MAG: helix-turn-helix domain-containing protein [Candidatus Hermodarchaeota archaeon]|nr:helix-turn-helix domain-containing protein [Candidatus Hermodarchaeota archaeon]
MPRKKRDPSKENWLSTAEIADITGYHARTILTWCKEGKIPYTRIGRAYRFNRKKIEKWLEKHASEVAI